MTYIIQGLPRARFAELFGLDNTALTARGARRVVADDHGFPCRVSLTDRAIGEKVLLLNHVSHDVAGPYRASNAIFVTEGEEEQAEYVEKALAENPDVRWTLIFMHKPLWDYEGENGWARIEDMLKDRPHTVFTGHRHSYMKYHRHGHKYFVFATTGGSSKMRGLEFGEFDHIVWVTMTPEGPRIANLLLDGILDENIRVAPAK